MCINMILVVCVFTEKCVVYVRQRGNGVDSQDSERNGVPQFLRHDYMKGVLSP